MGMNTHQIARAKAAVSGGAEQSAPVAENSSVKTATDMAFDAIEPHFEKLAAQLGRWIDPKKFVASCVNAIARDPNLIRALHDAPRTVIGAIYQAAECGFEPNTPLGNCYMIPRYAKDRVRSEKENRRVCRWEASFQLGYKGFKQLALRSGQFSVIPNATDVREGELVSRDRLTGECVFRFITDDEERSKAKVIGFASYFRLLNGAESTYYMSVAEIEKHALRYSQTYRSKSDSVRQSSKWTTDFNDMALKTVIKLNLSKNAPLSVEMQDAIRADQSVQYEQDKYEYVDNGDHQDVDIEKAQRVADKFMEFAQEDVSEGER